MSIFGKTGLQSGELLVLGERHLDKWAFGSVENYWGGFQNRDTTLSSQESARCSNNIKLKVISTKLDLTVSADFYDRYIYRGDPAVNSLCVRNFLFVLSLSS